jgi:TolB-like protein/Tfp pilus assembly protein PilF
VAVLPFRTVSDRGDDYLADGITDALITRLANLKGLRVVSYSRVRRFKGSALDAAEIGRQLGVDAVVEGTVRFVSGHMRFSVHAVDTKTADTTWADDRFEGTPAGLLRMERQLAEAVALRLRPRLTAGEQSRIRKSISRSVDAYDLVLRARSLIGERGSAADLRTASRMLERAIQLDPEFADAHGWLAFVQNATYGDSLGGPAILRSAISNANRALSIDPGSIVATHALVQISHHTGRAVEALLMARRALETHPEDLDATAGAALAYFRVGLIDRSLPLYQKALAAEPGNLEFRYQLARSYLYLGDYQEGINTLAPLPVSQAGMFGMLLYARAGQTEKGTEAVRTNLKRDPTDAPAAYFGGWVLSNSGDEKGAAEIWRAGAREAERELQEQENLHNRIWLGLLYARLGKREQALDQVNRALAPDPRHPWFLYFTARIHGLLDNRRQALDHLRAAIENGFLMLPYLELDLWPMMGFYKLRDDPEFLTLRADLARRVDALGAQY